ncbi:MAG TPA: hypothetical protein DIU15_18780 [Deltaproteobacteria bacterium]|nr:hypothetical protein [Deltaproteobacteria bacterium]HCP48091.1 hypothetical protein [Deltaproteobacteria bacterium]
MARRCKGGAILNGMPSVRLIHSRRSGATLGALGLVTILWISTGCTSQESPETADAAGDNILLGEEISCANPVEGMARFTEEGLNRGLDIQLTVDEDPTSCFVVPGGVVAQDLDGDGDDDLLVYRASGFPHLFSNDGTGHFTEVAQAQDTIETFGVRMSAHAAVDLTGDSLPEVIMTGPGLVLLAHNLGELSFGPLEVLFAQEVYPKTCFNTLSFGDADGDGDLDLILPGLDPLPEGGFNQHQGQPQEGTFDLLLLNEGGAFRLSHELSPAGVPGLSFLGAFTDRDNDGDFDVLITSDRPQAPMPPTAFYRNDGLDSLGQPVFENDAPEVSADLRFSAMGLGAADMNADGLVDYCMSDDYIYCLLSDEGAGYIESGLALGLVPDLEAHPDWSEEALHPDMGGGAQPGGGDPGGDSPGDNESNEAGLDCQPDGCPNCEDGIDNDNDSLVDCDDPDCDQWCMNQGGGADLFCQWFGWSVELLDFDHDGDLDLAAVAGPTPPRDPDSTWYCPCTFQPDALWEGNADGSFTERTQELGFGDLTAHYGMAAADFDGNGARDLIIVPDAGRPKLWMNPCAAGAWSEIELVGPAENAEAYGARVEVTANNQTQVRELYNLRSVGQSPSRLHFGLGDAETIDQLRVRWPDGTATEATNLPVRRQITLLHPRYSSP